MKMKKAISILCAAAFMQVSASANDDITVFLNGKQLEFDQPPIIYNDRTVVPMRKIFEELDKTNPELSQSIREKMFVFENILDMDDRSVQRFVRELDTKDVVYALKSASEDMKTIFFNNMSKRMADSVRGDLEITTNVRLKDVEEAQQRIVNVIRQLEEQGEVIIKKGGEDDSIIV